MCVKIFWNCWSLKEILRKFEMATIAESFLDDLNDLEDESSSENEQNEEEEEMDVEMSKEHLRAQETFISHMKNVTSALEVRFIFF